MTSPPTSPTTMRRHQRPDPQHLAVPAVAANIQDRDGAKRSLPLERRKFHRTWLQLTGSPARSTASRRPRRTSRSIRPINFCSGLLISEHQSRPSEARKPLQSPRTNRVRESTPCTRSRGRSPPSRRPTPPRPSSSPLAGQTGARTDGSRVVVNRRPGCATLPAVRCVPSSASAKRSSAARTASPGERPPEPAPPLLTHERGNTCS